MDDGQNVRMQVLGQAAGNFVLVQWVFTNKSDMFQTKQKSKNNIYLAIYLSIYLSVYLFSTYLSCVYVYVHNTY